MVLSKGGITWDNAMEMTANERLTHLIALGQMHGIKFNETTWGFERVPPPPPRILVP